MYVSNLALFESARVLSDNSIVFRSDKFKTMDQKKDDFHVYSGEVRQLIRFYVDRIRPVFAARYKPSLFANNKRVRELKSETALLVTRYGLRFQKFDAFRKVVEKLTGKHITATLWRKIISTESVERLSTEEAGIVRRNNTHDEKTA